MLKKGLVVVSKQKGFMILIISIIFLWWFLLEIGLIPAYKVPYMSSVFLAMISEGMWPNIEFTLIEIIIGYLLGVGIGISIGILFWLSSLAERVFSPISVFFSSVSKATLVSIFVAMVGFGLPPIILVVILTCFFPVVVNTVAGLKLVDPGLVELMRSLKATRRQEFTKVRFKSALPHIFSGLKIAAPLAVVGAVIAEFMVGLKGLGFLVQIGISLFQSPIVYSAVIWMGIIGLAFYGFILLIERLLSPWYVRMRKET